MGLYLSVLEVSAVYKLLSLAILCFMSGGLDTPGAGYLREKGEILHKFQKRQGRVRFVPVSDFIALCPVQLCMREPSQHPRRLLIGAVNCKL